jgi:hypothetical protein
MTNQELLELAKLSQANIHNRRAMEWRLLLGYWGGIALIVFAVLSGKVSPAPPVLMMICIGLLLLLFVVVPFCILPIQRAHAIDQELFKYYTRRIEGVANEAHRPKLDSIPVHRAWTTGQILFSVFLTLIAIVLIMG